METLKAARLRRDVVLVDGADAREYLQSQLTQDIVALDVGESAWSFLLEPKAQIVALVRATRTSDTAIVLDTDPGWGERIRERIDGFLFRMDVTFATATWDAVAYRGPGAAHVVATAPVVAPVHWAQVEGLDVVGPDLADPVDVPLVEPSSYESLRIWAGWPAMGTDIDDAATPAMTGLVSETVSFTKGCYTGQEFVARVHYRDAAPPRRLVQVAFHPCAKVASGDELVVDGQSVGHVTSVADCQPFALAYLDRKIEVPAEITCGGCPATAEALPARQDASSVHQ